MVAGASLPLVERLIAFDTTSRNSNLALIDYAAGLLQDAGARIRLTHDDSGQKANLFASLGPDRDGGYVLSGHTDVVPVDGQDWSSDPFRAVVRDGKLFGRGAADMKSFLGAALALLPSVRADRLARPLHFAFSYDEEVGCLGVTRLLDDLRQTGARPALAVIGEPTLMRIVGAHKGGSVLTTTCHGRAHHSSTPEKGANAVMMAGQFVDLIARAQTDAMGDTDTRFDPPYSTVQANMIDGGSAVNILAAQARITWECRHLPDRDGMALANDIIARADETILPAWRAQAPEARFETDILARYPGLRFETDSPAIALAQALTGHNAVEAVSYGTEAGHFQRAGIAAVICGPGSIEQAHRPDEFIALEQIAACEDFLEKLLARAYA